MTDSGVRGPRDILYRVEAASVRQRGKVFVVCSSELVTVNSNLMLLQNG